ncbi:hypothetical protein FisN_17Hh225 [Fistulifera solaris]|uniref:Uncharacterized protein n=1 Tax=Fistulifera solaris TaxID=1519565 RepID=A0A1Z5JH07_FISSO|nr:hypothetical protein FisN_17Hh225 [Fistulifera solaris]|eukprot:GAX13285.1 hypothetical protein FisN_17Hh225 [Fistulifera solaris]
MTFPHPSQDDPLLRSYQTGGRSVATPTIRHDDDVPSSWWYGNARLRPNIGLTNSYEYSFCGAVHESIKQLRTAVVVLSLATIFLLLWTWLWHLIMLQWTRLILSVYLAFLAFLLGLSDALLLSSPLRSSVNTNNGDDEHSFASGVTEGTAWTTYRGMETRQMLKDYFGVLFHPVGRPALLFFMASLCWSLKGILEALLGFLYFLVAVALIYLSRESEFRKGYYPASFLEEDPHPRTPIIQRTAQHGFSRHAWTSVEKNGRSGEKQSLLDNQ